MSEDSTPQPEPQEAPPAGPAQLPGRCLREARERQALTVEDVADRLHLQQAQVEALENDDYARFSAPIFVSGYLRSYSRLLGLDPEPMVRALEQQGLEQPPILSELTAKMPAVRRRSVTLHGRRGVYLGAALALAAVLWVVTRPAVVEFAQDGKPEDTVAASATPAGGFEAVPAAPAATEDIHPEEEPPPPSSEPMDDLVLRFSGESWVEVADVTGRRLAYRMGNAPDVLRLRGLAPFDILLGNAPNVSIEYNGKPYQNVPISRTNVASFRLGGTSDEGVKKDESQESDPAT